MTCLSANLEFSLHFLKVLSAGVRAVVPIQSALSFCSNSTNFLSKQFSCCPGALLIFAKEQDGTY